MQIGVIGGGTVGTGLAGFWQRAGHDVRISTRETLSETATFGEVTVLAVPASAVDDVLATTGALEGRVVVDATNNLSGGPSGREIAARIPNARVVKAFNTAFASLYDEIAAASEPSSMVFCGDDPDAKALAATLIRDAGFDPVDAGGLENADDIEALARLVIGLVYGQGRKPFVYRFEQP